MSTKPITKGPVTSGGFAGLATPCHQHSFEKATLDELFTDSLPKYLKDLGTSWGTNHCTTVSGLMAVPDGGPIDDCARGGAWDPELQLAHGGPLPFLSYSKGSRGVVESWPYVPKVKALEMGQRHRAWHLQTGACR